jgi:hypothetical protein
MMDVGRDDHAASGNLVANEFGVEVFTARDESHLLGDDALPSGFKLRHGKNSSGLLYQCTVREPLSVVDYLSRGGCKRFIAAATPSLEPKIDEPATNVCSRVDDERSARRIDTPVHLQVALGLDPVDHLADTPNLGERGV